MEEIEHEKGRSMGEINNERGVFGRESSQKRGYGRDEKLEKAPL